MAKIKTVLILILICIHVKTLAQFSFQFDNSIEIQIQGQSLAYGWSGGLNAGQYNTIDLNNDGIEDLVIYDRTSNRLITFLNDNNQFVYQPEYEYFFPEDVNSWLVLADFNCDGKKDIFTSTTGGIKVYENTSENTLSWQSVADPLFTQGSSSQINLQVNSSDIPAIEDIDGDGDLDILVFNFFSGGTIEYHQNQSIETSGNCNNLDFVRVDRNWGKFEECNCGDYAFGEFCPNGSRIARRPEHAGGKALLAFDNDGDGDKDILFGDEECEELVFFENEGSSIEAIMLSFNDQFPNTTNAIQFPIFPAAYYEDLDFDGIKDLIVAPNTAFNVNNQIDFARSSRFYKNSGSNDQPIFNFSTNNFLQNEMIDLGENASPLFFDMDVDGDADLLVASGGMVQPDGFYGTISLYENIGTPVAPIYNLIDNDYLGFSNLKFRNLQIQLTDVNQDNRPDLVFSGIETQDKDIYYLPNSGNVGSQFNINDRTKIPQSLNEQDNPYIFDIDQDGLSDLLIGKATGRIEHYRNTGNGSYELVTNEFFNIADDIFKRNPSIAIGDINADAKVDFLVTDATGKISIWNDLFEQLDGPSLPQTNILNHTLLNDNIDIRLGRFNRLTLQDIDGDGLADLTIGSTLGGIQYLKNVSERVPGGENQKLSLKLFPNPSLNNQTLKIQANDDASIAVYSVLGTLIMSDIELRNLQILQLDLSFLANGVYIVRGRGNNLGEASERLLIQK
ncbi:FG-GAP-like repeat-containing protein [Fulvivirgaceae bacterium BMA10]|uniref:FG-GAP-like repeat-containing protein n=1 Tax=Splendidivirga corallicola TaxID=3051826 RepID=A0ABT8KRB3_9BACT|nr:FG-GAP-like repeat-containing protein [Fulvivirgaceae bacterium BMA10]